MARPTKTYAIFIDGFVEHLCEGLAEAKLHVESARSMDMQASFRSFDTGIEPEEFAAWHNYRQPLARKRYPIYART